MTPRQMRAAETRARDIHLKRLWRLVDKRRDYRDDLNPTGLRLLDVCITATAQDARDLGATVEAVDILLGRR